MSNPGEFSADALADKGEAAAQRAQQALGTNDTASFNRPIRLLERAIDVAPSDWPRRPWTLCNLGLALQIRGRNTADLTDLNRAVEVLEDAARSAPSDHPRRCWVLNSLRTTLNVRFDRTQNTADQDRAVDVLEEEATSTPTTDPTRVQLFRTLRVALHARFERTGDTADLNRPIKVLELAERATPTGDAHRRELLLEVASALYFRYTQTGNSGDLGRAIKIHRRHACPEPEDSDQAAECSNFAIALLSRFESKRDPADLDYAIELLELAQAVTPTHHPEWAKGACNLAGALVTRFERTSNPEDLDRAVALFEDARDSLPSNHDARPGVSTNLAAALRTRFEHAGNPVDLDRAIKRQREALASTPPGHSSRPGVMANLGDDLQARFENAGDASDLSEAMKLLDQAEETCPDNHPDRPQILAVLAIALESRFRRTKDAADLDRAIEVLLQSTDPTRARHAHWPRFMSNLGNVLLLRFELSRDTDDLDDSIDRHTQALDATPDGDADKPTRLANLGAALLRRFESADLDADLIAATDALERAKATMPLAHRDRTRVLVNLASARWLAAERTGNVADVDRMLEESREAARNTAASLVHRAHAARYWGLAATFKQDWDQAAEGFGLAIELVALAVPWELDRADQEFRLSEFVGLGSEAAAAAIEAGDLAHAVELFEQGRAILFSQILDSRSDITELREAHEALADRFVHCGNNLNRPAPQQATAPMGDTVGGATSQHNAESRRAAAAEFQTVLSEIRALPGFERFLAPRNIDDLLPAADQGPVVLVNIAPLRSDALVITTGGVESIPLPDLGPSQVAAQTTKFLVAINVIEDETPTYDADDRLAAGFAIQEVLAWLADNLTTAVLEHLGYTSTPPTDAPWPRVWWCPSGLLSLLPIHAAGRHPAPSNDAVDAVIDRVISSNIPTLNALLHARVTPGIQHEPRLLVVVMPELAGAAHEATTLQ